MALSLSYECLKRLKKLFTKLVETNAIYASNAFHPTVKESIFFHVLMPKLAIIVGKDSSQTNARLAAELSSKLLIFSPESKLKILNKIY